MEEITEGHSLEETFLEALSDVHKMSKSDFLGVFEVVRLVAEQMAENNL